MNADGWEEEGSLEAVMLLAPPASRSEHRVSNDEACEAQTTPDAPAMTMSIPACAALCGVAWLTMP